jgi:hypothetical protein
MRDIFVAAIVIVIITIIVIIIIQYCRFGATSL